MGIHLFRHRLAVILGFFVVAVVAAVVVARGSGGAGIGPSSPWFAPSGLLCIVAFALRAWGEARVGAAVYGQRASARLVTSGPFARMRHPLYVGTWLFFVSSTAPYLPVVVAVVLAVGFAAALRAIAMHEEQELEQTHGDDWRRYAAAVPRFLGVPRAVVDDGVVVDGRAWAMAALSNLGMVALGLYRLATGAGFAFRGLRTLTLLAVVAWLVVVIIRRRRQQ
jgi:protein-S-isoprenylcysteine O-methyltransferase Ste14